MNQRAALLAGAFAAFVGGLIVALAGTPPSNVGQDEFFVKCGLSKNATFDPIVFPGQEPAGHQHTFFGSTTINKDSTPSSLSTTAGTTCSKSADRSGYWAPRPLLDGVPFNPHHVSPYYSNWPGTSPAVLSFPSLTTMIAGDKNATSPLPVWKVRYSCGNDHGVTSPASNIPYDCDPGQPTSKGNFSAANGFDGTVVSIFFPACWNGVIPATTQGAAPSVVYYVGPSCPSTHPKKLVRLSERIHLGVFDTRDDTGGVRLSYSSGSYMTVHVDFMNGWAPGVLAGLVQTCLNAAGDQHCSELH